MFYLIPVTHYQDMIESWEIWEKQYNLRMIKNKDWKELWKTGMTISIMSGNWTIDTSQQGIDQITNYMNTDRDWKHCYYEWETWWTEYEIEYMQSITFIQKHQLHQEFNLLKTEANDLNILETMKK